MSEIKNGGLRLYGAEHSKCNRVMTLRFKGLSSLCKLATRDPLCCKMMIVRPMFDVWVLQRLFHLTHYSHCIKSTIAVSKRQWAILS